MLDSQNTARTDYSSPPRPSTGGFGPMPMPEAPEASSSSVPKKRRRVLEHEQLFLEHLPLADMYESSYMHRDVVTHVALTK